MLPRVGTKVVVLLFSTYDPLLSVEVNVIGRGGYGF